MDCRYQKYSLAGASPGSITSMSRLQPKSVGERFIREAASLPQIHRVLSDLRPHTTDDLVDTDIVYIFSRYDLKADFFVVLDIAYTLRIIKASVCMSNMGSIGY